MAGTEESYIFERRLAMTLTVRLPRRVEQELAEYCVERRITKSEAVKQALTDAENFWVMHKKDDAIAMSKDSIAKVTALEAAVSAPMPDMEAVMAAVKVAGGTCGACHKQYREQDANMQYQLKAGTI